jgi:hypothetical protein
VGVEPSPALLIKWVSERHLPSPCTEFTGLSRILQMHTQSAVKTMLRRVDKGSDCQQDTQCAYNVMPRRVHVTIVAVEK